MTDRDLLEMAAKAAGYKVHIWGTDGSENVARMDTVSPTKWNPLTDDGDALKLAVDLFLNIEFSYCQDDAPIVIVSRHDVKWIEPNFPDPDAATCRAIVCAAAEIGKAMP